MTTSGRWYREPTVWLMLVLLGSTMAGSLGLVFVAYTHPDELPHRIDTMAAPLPPSAAAHPADQATP